MKTLTFVIALELLAAAAWGMPLTLDVNLAYVGNAPTQGAFTFAADGLAGTRFSGQTLTVDLAFGDGLVTRAFGAPGNLVARLSLDTLMPFDPTFTGAGSSGAVRLAATDALTPGVPLVLGNGNGLVQAWMELPGDEALSGFHYELALPDNGYDVTGARFDLLACCAPVTFGDWYGFQFGTPAQVPEPGTLALAGIALAALVGVGSWHRHA